MIEVDFPQFLFLSQWLCFVLVSQELHFPQWFVCPKISKIINDIWPNKWIFSDILQLFSEGNLLEAQQKWPWYLRVKGTSEHRMGTSELLHSLHVKNHFYCVGWFVTITYGPMGIHGLKCHVIIIGGLLLPWCASNMDDHSLDHPSYPSYIISIFSHTKPFLWGS